MIVDIVTPTRKLVDGATTDSVKLPSQLGELQILPGHTELLTILGTGILSFPSGSGERKFAVSYGFAEIRNDRILVLAETCEESTEIDKVRAQAAKKKAEEALAATLDEHAFRKYELKLQRAVVRQNIAD